jgi:hypothetical protein
MNVRLVFYATTTFMWRLYVCVCVCVRAKKWRIRIPKLHLYITYNEIMALFNLKVK